jgi:hypothetical protein
MSSLTPSNRSDEATAAASHEGFISALLTFIPTCGAIYIALQSSPTFRARTNWQSRTALAIMPAWFVFEVSSNHKLSHKMREMARENKHHQESVQWAEQQLQHQQQQSYQHHHSHHDGNGDNDRLQLRALYRQSVLESGVNIVPGNTLSTYHHVANYTADHPVKVLASLAVPAVAWIFYGNASKDHLSFSIKLLHTRVFGQFATISLLLSVMGFKEYMDQQGRYITELEAEARVNEMHQIRDDLQTRLIHDREQRKVMHQIMAAAHAQDVKKQHHHQEQQQHHHHHHATTTTIKADDVTESDT